MAGEDENIRNPVEEYMKEIMNLGKPEKSPQTTAKPTDKLEIKEPEHSSRPVNSANEAIKIGDTLKSANIEARKPGKPIKNIHRHPIGLIFTYLSVVIGYAVFFSLISFFLPGLADTVGISLSTAGTIIGMLMIILALLGFAFLALTTRLYFVNRLILTEESMKYVLPSGLNDKKTTEIALSDIKNISLQQEGSLASLLNYGTLSVETSEDQDNIFFNYLPDPAENVKGLKKAAQKSVNSQTTL